MSRGYLKLVLGSLCIASLVSTGPAFGQKTKAQLNTEVGTTFPDQSTGQITPSGVRTFQSDVINSIMPTAPVVSGNFSCFNGTTGLLQDCGTSPSNIAIPNSNLVTGPANTVKGSLNGTTTSDLAIASCSAIYQSTQWVSGTGWQCGINPVLPSRAIAATLNLSAFTAITTQGYARPSDGGEATFKKIGSTTPFTDTYVNGTPTVVGGSGYTNGTYLGVPLQGGSGGGCLASVTVSGGIVTVISVVSPCAGYKVGEVLTPLTSFVGGTGSGSTYTITSISNPTASFIDSAGNRFQFVPRGIANILQFGCKGDWLGTDAGATNNLNCLQNAASWAGFPLSTSLQFGIGNRVYLPQGNYMTCGVFNNTSYSLAIPQGVWFDGSGIFGTSLIQCATDPASAHYIELCDSNALTGQFGCRISNMVLSALQINTSTAGAALIYSNSGQQFVLAENIEADGGFKGCVKYELGKGGAANDIWIGIDCNLFNGATNPAFSFNSPTAQHILQRSVAASTGTSSLAINNAGGRLVADGIDIEGYITGLQQNVTTGGVISSFKNVQQQSAGCSQAITLVSGNVPGNIIFENISTSCPVTITNGQPGGSSFTGNVVKQITCVSGACS
ncbi:hypothetical protein IVB03_02940 [Bradyrhizobium sp. 168]|uniref:hypothetical protein n=1 Tax=Bradyrhizobium sp. 168 TaxID=2782639 RepID=UPI001FF76268|nr:hypothetical protein [Bradyrhizobium sp. 168]MCK1578564.1 hypothetical protein [Bradyrhizobium sp. 168]